MIATIVLALLASPPLVQQDLDALLDNRWGPDKEIVEFADRLKKEKVTPEKLEAMIRAPRASYKELPNDGKEIPLTCDHVDYTTGFFLQLPKDYKKGQSYPLLVVFHGGNSAMSKSYATQAAQTMNYYWRKWASDGGYIMATPLTERGWNWIGTSVAMSLVSKLSRSYQIDPDRVYITGHSMGGHMTWRTSMYHPDHWAAVSPMSGGYDYVADGQIANLWNVPGYVTFGKQEPYQINEFNKKMSVWAKDHKLDWVFHECDGGHTIYPDELPQILNFFKERPRDLYRKDVFVRQSGPLQVNQSEPKNPGWDKQDVWDPKRPLERNGFYWVKVLETGPKKFKDGELARLRAVNQGDNKFLVTTDNVKKLRLYFHPKMANLAKPIELTLNGSKQTLKVKPDLAQMLRTVRSEDDRGKVFYGYVDLTIKDDQEVPYPTGRIED